MSVSEQVHEHKVSVVREAIESAIWYLEHEAPFDPDAVYHGDYVKGLLRVAWLSLEKCAVCGRECQGYPLIGKGVWVREVVFNHGSNEWLEMLCSDCTARPDIGRFWDIPF